MGMARTPIRPTIKVLFDGEYFSEIDHPSGLDTLIEISGEDPARFSLDLADVKVYKEKELRDTAQQWFEKAVRSFEGNIVIHQSATGATMTPQERDIRAIMQANYQKVRKLVSDILAASDWRTALAVSWGPPQSARINEVSSALGQVEQDMQAIRGRRKKRKPVGNKPEDRIARLEERISELEAESEARRRIFEV